VLAQSWAGSEKELSINRLASNISHHLLVDCIADVTVITVAIPVIRLLMSLQSHSGDIRRFVGTQRTEMDSLVVFVVDHVSLQERAISEDFSTERARRWLHNVDISDVLGQGVASRSRFSAVIAGEDCRVVGDRVHSPRVIRQVSFGREFLATRLADENSPLRLLVLDLLGVGRIRRVIVVEGFVARRVEHHVNGESSGSRADLPASFTRHRDVNIHLRVSLALLAVLLEILLRR
jgi:hypothetical protein